MEKKIRIIRYAAGIPVFILGVILKSRDMAGLSSAVFIFLAGLQAAAAYLESGKILDMRIFLSLTWLVSVGLAVLGLSELQNPWEPGMWASVGGFYFLFLGSYDLLNIRFLSKKVSPAESVQENGGQEKLRRGILQALIMVFILGFAGFMLESVKFSFDYPFFSDKPHAYTSFHITGVHYFVVSVVFVHPLTAFFCLLRSPDRREKILLFTVNALSLLISVLILSKFQLLFGLEMTLVTWILLQKRFSKKQILLFSGLAALIFFAGSTLMILMRKYPEDYLQGIFLFRDRETPIAFQYVYSYMVNNFENLNLLFREAPELTLGRRSLYPFLCLTGLKFLPALSEFMWVPKYYTCVELNTLTILYDAVGDFGLAGAAVFSAVLGALAAAVNSASEKKQGVLPVFIYAQLLLYLFLAFFSTWFSNPTAWFGFAYTILIALVAERERVISYLRRKAWRS